MNSEEKRRFFRWPWRTREEIRDDVDEEIAFHFEMRINELVQQGMDAGNAHDQAVQEFGDVEAARAALRRIDERREKRRRLSEWLDEIWRDIGYATRLLHRNPGFATVAIVTLALGIGANTSIFSVVDAILLKPLPYFQPERLVAVWASKGLMLAEFEILREQNRSFEDVAVCRARVGFGLSGAGEAERIVGASVSSNLFSVLGVSPLLGRAFLPTENTPGQDRVVLLSYGLWLRHFGGERGVLGKELIIDGLARNVVGVMPPDVYYPAAGTEIWVPFTIDRGSRGAYWGTWAGHAVARVKAGHSPEQAQAEVRALAKHLRLSNPLWTPSPKYGDDAEVRLLHHELVGEIRQTLVILMIATGLVLLIACVNVANLLLVRGLIRAREIAVRAALGASSGRVVRLLLSESFLLTSLGSGVGLLLSFLSVPLLVSLLPSDTPRLAEITINARVLMFAVVCSFLTALVFGLVPSYQICRAGLYQGFREAPQSVSGKDSRLSKMLVVTEVAIAVTLVIAAGLLIQSLWRLQGIDPGFRTEHLVSARVTPPEVLYRDGARRRNFYRELLTRVQSLPGVLSVAGTTQFPFDQEYAMRALAIEGVTTDPNDLSMFDHRAITPNYFQLVGVPILKGRGFDEADREGSPPVAIIDETAARQFWPADNPLGKYLGRPWLKERLQIVGVVGSVRNNSLVRERDPAIYVPFAQDPSLSMTFVIRTERDPSMLVQSLRAAVGGLDPNVPVSQIGPVEHLVSRTLAKPRLTGFIFAAFAALATLLGAVGIYGVLSYSVRRRTPEIGVRMALGADKENIFRLVMRDAAILTAVGIGLGIPAALVLSKGMRTLLYEIRPTDPATLVVVSLLLIAVSLLAAYLPARRAARMDPMQILRSE